MRDELMIHIEFRRKTESQTPLWCAAIIAWVATRPLQSHPPEELIFVAVVVAALGAFRWYAVNEKIGSHVRYLEILENHFLAAQNKEIEKSSEFAVLGPQQYFIIDKRGQDERKYGLLFAVGFVVLILFLSCATYASMSA